MSLITRSVFFTLLLPGLLVGWMPWRLLSMEWRYEIGAYRAAGLVLIASGGLGLLWCVWDFARAGRGTLAPVDPPRFVVRGGLYGRVRNPMYVANLLTLTGEGIFFESAAIFAWAVLLLLANHLFVVFYEEPTLRRTFGDAYEEYCRSVPRWIPTVH